ncbi:MAG: hypothetical protein ACLF0G_11755 [Candidatus Brocadiia bacterium]
MIDEELEFKIEQLDLMIKRWKRLFALYRKVSKPGEASPKEEREYAELATYFARTYLALATRCGLKPDPQSSLITMVTDVPDAEAIREMSDMQRRKFENDWRVNNAQLNQKLGELQLLSEELQDVSEVVYYGKRFLSNRVVQITLGAAIVVVLLGAFGVFGMIYDVAMEFVKNM